MRLAIDASRSDVRSVTGTERYSREIISAITSLSDRPDLTLYTRGDRAQPSEETGIEVVPIERRRLWTHVGLSRALHDRPPDALFVPSHVIPAVHPPVSVVTIHDLGYIHQPESHPRRQRLMLEAATRWNVHAATRIIAISEVTRRDLIDRYGASADQIDVIHHGIDHDHFRQLDRAILRQRLLELGLREPYVLFVSTLHPRKNIGRLVAAFERLNRHDLTLVITGKPGWDVAPILRRVALSKAAGRIILLGHVDDADLPILYNSAEVFVLPSLYEGFGMGIIEAMACGCPVVTSNRSSMPEIAGDAAILVEPTCIEGIRAGIEEALDPSTRGQLADQGLKRAAEFRWDVAARKTLQSIGRAVRGHSD